MRGQLSEALRIINCLRALARVFMVQQTKLTSRKSSMWLAKRL
jgi:hypothetical protein